METSKRYACLTFGCLVESKIVSYMLTNSIAQQEVILDDGFLILISISHIQDVFCIDLDIDEMSTINMVNPKYSIPDLLLIQKNKNVSMYVRI